MSAFKIVQKIPSLTIAATAGISTSSPISLKSGYLRIVPSGNCFIEIGTNPGINTSTSIWVSANSELILKESVRSQPTVGIITGTTTTAIIPEGTSSAFDVGDYVELTGISTTGINTNFAQVLNIDNASYNQGGYYNAKIILNWNTSSRPPVINGAGELRKVTKIAAYNDSASPNTIHITEVQVVSNFN
jgi:hypothetical protein